MAAMRASATPTWGTSEPATAARATSRRSTSAVRIERRVRQARAVELRSVSEEAAMRVVRSYRARSRTDRSDRRGEAAHRPENPTKQARPQVGRPEHPDRDHHNAGDPGEPVVVTLHEPEGTDETADTHADEQEREPEAGRVHEQQQRAAQRTALGGRDRENPREHRADAGRPPRAEGHPEREGPAGPRPDALDQRSALGGERRRAGPERGQEHQHAERDDDHP